MKEKLIGKTYNEIARISEELNFSSFTTRQLAEWLYKKQINSVDDMTNLSKENRNKLKEKYVVGLEQPVNVETSKDGTKKYLFKTSEGGFIESAYIPEKNRATLCLSTQVGCRMGCKFCLTAKQGFRSNLTSADILNQIFSLPEKNKLTNLVFMGMGEPFDNYENLIKSLEIITSDYGLAWSPKRITVSTIGILTGIKRFLQESQCHLAISLHSPFEDERKLLMPAENTNPLKEIIGLIRSHNWGKQRRISFEYILFKNFNDSDKHALELAKLLNGLRCRINLIRFHTFEGTAFECSNAKSIERFQKILEAKGFITTIRASRGFDISAACGLLSTKKQQEK